MNSLVSMGVLLGQLFAVLVLLALGVMAIRFLMAATLLMKRKAEHLERETGRAQ